MQHQDFAKQTKLESEKTILEHGGKINSLLPWIDDTQSRRSTEIISRALILTAMIQINFDSLIGEIRQWVEDNQLNNDLGTWEQCILTKKDEEVSDQEKIILSWYIEALWTLMWVGQFIESLPFNKPAEERIMVSLCPLLRDNGSAFIHRFRLREKSEVFKMLDLYYRLHWFVRDSQMRGYSTGDINLDIVMERRRVLEWVIDRNQDWDSVNLNT